MLPIRNSSTISIPAPRPRLPITIKSAPYSTSCSQTRSTASPYITTGRQSSFVIPAIYCGLMEAGIYFLTNFVSVEQNRFFFFPSYSHFPFERYLVGMQQSKFGFRGNVQRQTESIQGPGGEILVRVHSRMAYVEVVSQLEQDIRPNVTNARQSFPIIAGA